MQTKFLLTLLELHCHCHWRQQLALGTRTTVLSFSVCYCCLLFIRMQFFIEVVKLILLCGKVWCCYSLSLCCLSLLFSYESIPEFKSHIENQGELFYIEFSSNLHPPKRKLVKVVSFSIVLLSFLKLVLGGPLHQRFFQTH